MTEHGSSNAAWGARAGNVAPRRPAPVADAAGLIDRQAITEVIACYAWAYDERDAGMLGDVFAPDGVWRGSIQGTQDVGPFEGRAAIVEFLTSFWDIQSDQRRHNFMNVLVLEQDAERAQAIAYILLTAGEGTDVQVVTTGPYRFTLAKDGGVWRVTELLAGFDVPF
ncbi:nuclear transport factor 2 family protein [Baekduia soli]|uniref:Nuclear transport factor 2 family protein n=1 Tax=Baekduia soli TaxID=496014 RepID=A0A5B8U0P0_9ACTN|nr:nuclear transport factor 2 family protein [Baekduia soli]QEC46500.1 nuclear transport factor 2 family protein [Baekduia soli]